MKKSFAQQLKKNNPTLYQIHEFIMSVAELGYGEICFDIKAHDYVARMVEMQAKNPKKNTTAKSITKRVMVKKGGSKLKK